MIVVFFIVRLIICSRDLKFLISVTFFLQSDVELNHVFSFPHPSFSDEMRQVKLDTLLIT